MSFFHVLKVEFYFGKPETKSNLLRMFATITSKYTTKIQDPSRNCCISAVVFDTVRTVSKEHLDPL